MEIACFSFADGCRFTWDGFTAVATALVGIGAMAVAGLQARSEYQKQRRRRAIVALLLAPAAADASRAAGWIAGHIGKPSTRQAIEVKAFPYTYLLACVRRLRSFVLVAKDSSIVDLEHELLVEVIRLGQLISEADDQLTFAENEIPDALRRDLQIDALKTLGALTPRLEAISRQFNDLA